MTTEQPYATWHEDHAQRRAETHVAHAVAMTDGKPASLTVCGQRVVGPTGELFVWTRIPARCPHCAEVLGAAHT